MNQWPHKCPANQVGLYSAVLTQAKSQAEGKKKKDMRRAAGSFLRLGRQTSFGTATESHVYHLLTWTPGLSAWALSLAASLLTASKEGWHARRKEGEAALGAGRPQGEQSRVRQGSWITGGAWDCFSANAKELLLEQDNLSWSDRVNFQLAESFWLFHFHHQISGAGSC